MSEYPQRRIKLLLEVQADTWEDLANHLYDRARQVERGEMRGPGGFSGGWSSGDSYEITVNPDMDGDKYRAWLEEWSAKRKAQRDLDSNEEDA